MKESVQNIVIDKLTFDNLIILLNQVINSLIAFKLYMEAYQEAMQEETLN